jgi:outer membrane protein TolC
VNNDFNYFRAAILLGMDWNLNFLHHKDEARVRRLQANQLQAQLPPLSALVEQEVREAYLAARRAQVDLEEGRSALQASENWFRAEMQTFDIGIGEIKDVIDAFQGNVEMQTVQLRNIAAFNVAVAELSQRVGTDVGGMAGNSQGPDR